jgi:hypothetical protein
MNNTVIIKNQKEFDAFYNNINNKQESNAINTLIIYNVSLEASTILALHKLLPNMKEFNYNDPDLAVDSDDEDDHHACFCHRNDRYE